MDSIAVVHPDLSVRGGAEDVCMHILEALQQEYELTLFTLSGPDIAELNGYFGTQVDGPDVRVVGRLGPHLNRVARSRLTRLQAAVLARAVQHRHGPFDVIVSTRNEFGFAATGTPAVEYVHSPQFTAADPGLDIENTVRTMYNATSRSLAGFDPSNLGSPSSYLLANSNWTAGKLEEAYNVDAETVYPPVDTESFPKRTWTEREDGFLTIGRIDPSKRILENVDVIDRIRDRGHDVHLHIVGPTTDSEYSREVKRRAADKDFVTFEGTVSRQNLVDLITNHRYGLHGRPYEHFGIVVAELVEGGTIPFAPDSGGQREILGEDTRLVYNSPDEAVEKIDRVLASQSLQADLRESLQTAGPDLGRERFKDEIRTVVRRALS